VRKRCDLEQKNAIWEKIALLRANQIARITSDFKMNVINIGKRYGHTFTIKIKY